MIKHKIDWSHSIPIVGLCFLFLRKHRKLEIDQRFFVLFCFVLFKRVGKKWPTATESHFQFYHFHLSVWNHFWGDKKDSVIRRQFVCYFVCVRFFFVDQRDHSIFMCDKWERHDIVWAINKRKGVQKPFEQCKVLNTNNQLWQMPKNMDCALMRIEIGRMPRTRTISDKCRIHVLFVLQWWRWRSHSIVINICPKVYRPLFAVHLSLLSLLLQCFVWIKFYSTFNSSFLILLLFRTVAKFTSHAFACHEFAELCTFSLGQYMKIHCSKSSELHQIYKKDTHSIYVCAVACNLLSWCSHSVCSSESKFNALNNFELNSATIAYYWHNGTSISCAKHRIAQWKIKVYFFAVPFLLFCWQGIFIISSLPLVPFHHCRSKGKKMKSKICHFLQK